MNLTSVRKVSPGKQKLQFRLHAGQRRALTCPNQTVLVLAGTQGGKTVTGPVWLFREMQRKGPGDYLVVAPTFAIMDKKVGPETQRLFETNLGLGKYYRGAGRYLEIYPARYNAIWGEDSPHHGDETPTRILFGHAQDPDSLESMTAKAAWLDEAGQKKFKIGSYEAIRRRLSIANGRDYITTTPYTLGWLKTELHDKAVPGGTEGDIGLVRFESIMNPTFPREVWERAKRDLPRWKFDLFYRAIFTRPAGLIYDSFKDEDVVPRFEIPEVWDRYIGVDFGGVNTAAMFYAREPNTGVFYAYREYHPGEQRKISEHVRAILKGEPGRPKGCVGGAPSEGQWRREFGENGLGIERPRIKDVEVGIDRVYAAHKESRIRVFNDLRHYLDEKRSYSRKLDDTDNPTDEIEDKHSYHLLDAERYIISQYVNTSGRPPVSMVSL